MAHARNRYLIQQIIKKLRFFPVLAIQGSRQTGKSFLAREMLPRHLTKARYVTFDDSSVRKQAAKSPLTFLRNFVNTHPLIVDEAQKVPDLFDAVKALVDQKRIPGSFLLLGSTEFSHLSLIRESLTGRMGRTRLFPFTLTESLGLPAGSDAFTRANVLKYLRNGGMPGIFSVRDESNRDHYIKDWLDLICMRDIHQFKKLKLDSELCFDLIRLSATLREPTRAELARETAKDPRRVQTHLQVLCELFVLNRLNPHPSGAGKPIYLPLDCAVAHYFGATDEKRLQIWLLNERMAHAEYFETKGSRFFYYRSTGKKIIPLIVEPAGQKAQAFQIVDFEHIRKTDVELLRAFLAKNPGSQGTLLAPVTLPEKINGIAVKPWEDLITHRRSG